MATIVGSGYTSIPALTSQSDSQIHMAFWNLQNHVKWCLKRAILDFRWFLCSESHAKSSIRVLLSLHFGCSNCSSYPQADSHGDHSGLANP